MRDLVLLDGRGEMLRLPCGVARVLLMMMVVGGLMR